MVPKATAYFLTLCGKCRSASIYELNDRGATWPCKAESLIVRRRAETHQESAHTLKTQSSCREPDRLNAAIPYSHGQSLPGISLVKLPPACGCDHTDRGDRNRERRECQDNKEPGRKRFLFRKIGGIDDVDGRNFLGLLNSCQFILLGEQVVYRFLDLDPPGRGPAHWYT